MKFEPGQKIIVTGGDFQGYLGTVDRYEQSFGLYIVNLNTAKVDGTIGCREDEIELADSGQEVTDEVDVPEFGMTVEDFQEHLEYLLGRSLDHVGNVGPEQAFFSFQEFEGQTAGQVLAGLLTKIEEGMAMFAQAHILIGRTILALETVNGQLK